MYDIPPEIPTSNLFQFAFVINISRKQLSIPNVFPTGRYYNFDQLNQQFSKLNLNPFNIQLGGWWQQNIK